jgi:acetylornithine deacetylase/succinyl-diaminopimelate desuccinylase-like protein
VPHGDNSAERLVRALARVSAWEQPLQLTPVMRAHLEAMARAGGLKSASEEHAFRAAAHNPALRARLANTISLTTITGGIKTNVIPAEAFATLDCRLLPGVDADQFLEGLRAVIADDRVELEVLNRFDACDSPVETEFTAVVHAVVSELIEGAAVVPELTSGFTDSRIFRARGVPAYGFVPCLVAPEELAGVHGHNERISVENLRLGMQVLYEVVRRLCA